MKRFINFYLLFMFILGSHKGHIALWDDPNSPPVEVYPYRLTSLPPADQIALEKGIVIENSTELSSLLEDYLS